MASRGSRGLWLANEKRRAKRDETQRDINALNEIHSLLDGKEWGSDTFEDIAEIIRETGREVRDPNYEEDEE